MTYHVNPETGVPGPCAAKYNCPFGVNAPHAETIKEVMFAFEKMMELPNARVLMGIKKEPKIPDEDSISGILPIDDHLKTQEQWFAENLSRISGKRQKELAGKYGLKTDAKGFPILTPSAPSPFSAYFAEEMTEKFKNESEFTPKLYTVMPGKKYDRIVQNTVNGNSGSVHCFIERKTGFVFKASGWAAPAKGSRFNSVNEALSKATWTSGYLYK